jgi:hypothetical protein
MLAGVVPLLGVTLSQPTLALALQLALALSSVSMVMFWAGIGAPLMALKVRPLELLTRPLGWTDSVAASVTLWPSLALTIRVLL